MKKNPPISVFEHDKLTLKSHSGFDEGVLSQLEKYYGTEGTPFFSLIHQGVKFNQYVGVIQVGKTTIEVLPKIDRYEFDEGIWRNVLVDMLRITSGIEAASTSKSDLKLRKNSIFDLYVELFIKECEDLTHRGLIKKYRRVQENKNVLRGRLHIPGQIKDNMIHKERFFVENQRYDRNHLINQILKKTLVVLSQISIRHDLRSRLKRQLLFFEEIADYDVNERTFDRISLSRKSETYSEAIQIARLILLNYHPDISKGSNHVLALMFDMNLLWERFITKMMKRHLSGTYKVKGQRRKLFWEAGKTKKHLKPDIVLSSKALDSKRIIVDTKWKAPSKQTPSDNGLRQIFAYNHLFEAERGILLYPGKQNRKTGEYKTESGGICSMEFVNVIGKQGRLVKSIDLFSNMFETS